MNSTYEQRIIMIMRDYDLTMAEAIAFDFEAECVDVTSALGMCDYLEEQTQDLDRVQYYMMIYNGQAPDLQLRKIQ